MASKRAKQNRRPALPVPLQVFLVEQEKNKSTRDLSDTQEIKN